MENCSYFENSTGRKDHQKPGENFMLYWNRKKLQLETLWFYAFRICTLWSETGKKKRSLVLAHIISLAIWHSSTLSTHAVQRYWIWTVPLHGWAFPEKSLTLFSLMTLPMVCSLTAKGTFLIYKLSLSKDIPNLTKFWDPIKTQVPRNILEAQDPFNGFQNPSNGFYTRRQY